MTAESALRAYNKYEIRTALAFAVSYLALFLAAHRLLPSDAYLYPSTGIAIATLYFGGGRLSPAIFVIALASSLIAGFNIWFSLAIAIAVGVQAYAGANVLREFGIDPLFRTSRDIFILLGTCALVALIGPSIVGIVLALQGAPFSFQTWEYAYVANVFCLFLVLPFLLRWLTKPRFHRTLKESIETAVPFLMIAGICALFVLGVPDILGIPLSYVMLVPLFWISLRQRPRFLSLALLATATFVVVVLAIAAPVGLPPRLFGFELLFIALTVIFFVFATLREELRVNTTVMGSQLAILENAVARTSMESQAKNDFIAVLGHELRNPLAVVLSQVELMKMKGIEDEDHADAVQTITESAFFIRRLLEDLLDTSRIAEGKIDLAKKRLDLVGVVRRAIQTTAHQRDSLDQSLVEKLSKTPLYVEGDATRLEQVFTNLLGNASKYSDPGDKITVNVARTDGIARVEIIDEGIGIPRRVLEAIFLPFQQEANGERSKKGLGIGLALVKSFVEMHGGSVIAESEGEGKGSRFIVELPSAPDSSQNHSEKDGPAPSVLVVDDNDAAAGSMGRLLELQGASVSYAYEWRQAVDEVQNHDPDIVLINTGMRSRSGFAVAEYLKERGRKARLVALVESASEWQKAAHKHFDSYIVKPVTLSDVRKLLIEQA